MIEELKLLLDQMKNVPDVALWILGGFLLYKLVTYMSATGAIVYIVKQICSTILGWKNQPRKVSYGRLIIDEETETDLQDLIRSIRSTAYVHNSDVRELRKAWSDYKAQKTTV